MPCRSRACRSSREWSPFFTFHVDRNRIFVLLKMHRSDGDAILCGLARLALNTATGPSAWRISRG